MRGFFARVGLVGAVRFLVSMKGLILLPILARELGVENYGIWAQILVTITLLLPIALIGLPSGMVRHLSGAGMSNAIPRSITAVLIAILFWSLVLTLIGGLLVLTVLGQLSPQISSTVIVLVGGYVITLAITEACLEIFRTIGRFGWYSFFVGLIGLLETVAVVIAVGELHLGIEGILSGMIFGRAAVLLLVLFWIHNQIGLKTPDFSLLKPYLVFGIPLLPLVFFEVGNAFSDRYIISYFHGNTQVAIYTVAYTLGTLMAAVLYPLSYVLAPATVRIFDEHDHHRVSHAITAVTRVFMIIAIPAVVGLGILGPNIIRLLASPEFVGTATQLVIFMVAGGVLFDGIRAFYGNALMLNRDTKSFAVITVVAGLTNFVLNLIFVPVFGIGAAAVTTFVSYGILGLLIAIRSRRIMHISFPLLTTLKSVIASVVMGSVLLLIAPSTPLSILASVAIGASIYLSIMLMIRGLQRRDVENLRHLSSTG